MIGTHTPMALAGIPFTNGGNYCVFGAGKLLVVSTNFEQMMVYSNIILHSLQSDFTISHVSDEHDKYCSKVVKICVQGSIFCQRECEGADYISAIV